MPGADLFWPESAHQNAIALVSARSLFRSSLRRFPLSRFAPNERARAGLT